MKDKFVIYSIDKSKFMSNEFGRNYTFDINEAMEFETLNEARYYFNDHIPSESVIFLQVVATE